MLFLLVLSRQAPVAAANTAITQSNFQTAVDTCLETAGNDVDGLCSFTEYGSMPGWDVSAVTDMSSA